LYHIGDLISNIVGADMSFLRRRKDKIKTIRSESKLDLQKGMDGQRESQRPEEPSSEVPVARKKIDFKQRATMLEEKLNTPETRKAPQTHINIMRNLAKTYLRLGRDDSTYFPKAENLYKQFSVLYPLHMEKMDWITWITASAKARLIREARNLLSEARLLFPGDEDFDKVETQVLHIGHTQ
jgi:hypothetical protein